MQSVQSMILRRAVQTGAVALMVAGAVQGVSGFAGGAGTVAAPLVCTSAAAASPATTGAAATAAGVTPVPTQAPAEPEKNPPGDIPDNQAFVPYVSAEGGYTISMPEGWARTENGPNVTFADKLHTFTVEVACSAAAPTVDSVVTSEAVDLARQVPAFELVDVSPVTLPAGPAVRIRYRANSAPDDVTGKQYRLDVDRYEVFANGKVAMITLAVPAGSDNVDVANLVSRSFQWTA